MWPLIPGSQIDWGDTAQMVTALFAGGALIWSVIENRKRSFQDTNLRLASIKLEWIEDFRRDVSQLASALVDIVAGVSEIQEASKAQALAHRVTLTVDMAKHPEFLSLLADTIGAALVEGQRSDSSSDSDTDPVSNLIDRMLAEAYDIIQTERATVEHLVLAVRK